MARKLHDIAREPPANFHAPQGYQSVQGGGQKRAERQGGRALHCTARARACASAWAAWWVEP